MTLISERKHRHEKYHWQTSELVPCSATCGSAITTARVTCVDSFGKETDFANCDLSIMPDNVPRICADTQVKLDSSW